MEASFAYYDFNHSIDRITESLNTADACYEDHAGIPQRDRLTFQNGFYVSVTVVFIDMRGSKELAGKHTRPVLAKIYRSFISEMVAVLRGNLNTHEIYIEGDGVWAVYNTPLKTDIDSVFATAAQAASLVDILNVKLSKKNYSKFNVGIGIDYGESLYIKAGYKGSGINEVVWIGKVVGNAAKLCSEGSKNFNSRTMVSNVIYSNLSDHNKSLLGKNYTHDCYHGVVVNSSMNAWVVANG